jgi:chain length determinant protein tyrosine kinase EpsG
MDQNNAIPVSGAGRASPRDERAMGVILVHAERLSPDSAERILQLQREEGRRFGDAGIELGLLDDADVEFALSRQFDCPYLVQGESGVSQRVIAAYVPLSPQAIAMGALRNQIMLRWFDGVADHKALAIVSAERGDGRSYIAANLAVAFSQLGQKTLLIDADMRNADQHALFGIENRSGLSSILSGRGVPEALIQQVPGLPGLSVLPAGTRPPNPLELLARPLFPQLLEDLARRFDVILLDSPAASQYADAQSVTLRARAALVVARKDATRMRRMHGISDSMSQGSATVIGTVLNDF